jgi:hypothetical protein
MVELDTNPNVRFQISTSNSLKHKLDEAAEKSRTERSKFLSTYLERVDFTKFNVLDKRLTILLPIDQNNLENLILHTTSNGKTIPDLINAIINAFYKEV